MELIFILLLWAVVALLGYRLWVLRKTYGSFRHILEQFPARIRSGLGVVGDRELKDIQEKFFRLEQQVHARKVSVTTAEKFSHQFREYLQEVESPEPSDKSFSAMDGSVPRPRSIMWKGLRFTLSDSIWLQMGVVPKEDIEDDQVQAMVQGPFCRVCLKRLVGRDRVQVAEVPAQCHNCGLSWSIESDNRSMPLGDLKRMVYDMLARKVRTSRDVQC
jgi:hypothetical protein